MAYWLFQADPKRFRLEEALSHLDEMSWVVNQHQNDIRAGDYVLLWKSGDGSGVQAIARVLTDPQVMPGDEAYWEPGSRARAAEPTPQVRLKILQSLVGHPITKSMLKAEPSLASLRVLGKYPRGSNFRVEKAEWDRIAELVATTIRAQIGASVASIPEEIDEDEEDLGAPEGRVVLRQHRIRERSGLLARKKKDLAKRKGAYICEVCGFNKDRKFAPVSDAAIECHHKTPLSQLLPGQNTTLSELMLVCANCHRMLHHPEGNFVSIRRWLKRTQ